MTKICFLLHLPPPVHGSSLVGELIKNNKLINTTFDCRYINLLSSQNLNETGKTGLRKVIRFLNVVITLIHELIYKKPDLCYFALTATDIAFYKDVLLVVFLRLFHVKLIFHMHNKGVSNFSTNRINAQLYKFIFKDADVILLSSRLHEDIKQFVPISKIHFCPNGISDSKLKSIYIHKIETFTKILFLSNLIISKGILELLDACMILKTNGARFTCTVIGGEGDLSAEQFEKSIHERKLENYVNYCGKQFGTQKEKAFIDADLFVFPTYYAKECFPLVLLEAMCFSLPIVSTFEGGIPDIVDNGQTGFLVEQRNVIALAQKIELLINNPKLRKRMGENGRKKYESFYTLKKFEKKLVFILKNVTNNCQ